METSLKLYQAKLQFFSTTLSRNKDSEENLRNQNSSTNSDINKKAQNHSFNDKIFNQQRIKLKRISKPIIGEELTQKIKQKSPSRTKAKSFMGFDPQTPTKFSPYIRRMMENQRNIREILIYKSLRKNVKEIKIQKYQPMMDSIGFHKNLVQNHIESSEDKKLYQKQKFSMTIRERMDPINHSLIVLGHKRKNHENLQVDDERNMSFTVDLPRIIEAARQNYLRKQKMLTSIDSCQHIEAWTPRSRKQSQSLTNINFITAEKVNLKEKPKQTKKSYLKPFTKARKFQ